MTTFPILNSQELQRILAELEIIQPNTTFQQIPKTSYGSIYYALIYKLLGAKHPFPQPPQGYQDFSKIYIYHVCKKHFPKFNITDLCVADILNPSAQRFQAHLSGIVNFIRIYLKYQLIMKQYISSINQQQNENNIVNQEQNKSKEKFQRNTRLATAIQQIRQQMKQPLDELSEQCNHYLKKMEYLQEIKQQLQKVNQEKAQKQQLFKEKFQQYQHMLDEVPAEAKQYLQDQSTQVQLEHIEKEIESKKIKLQDINQDIDDSTEKLKYLEECSKIKAQEDNIGAQDVLNKINFVTHQIKELQRLKETLLDFQQQKWKKQAANNTNKSQNVFVPEIASKISETKITELCVNLKHLITQLKIQSKAIKQLTDQDVKEVLVYQK